MKLIAHVDMNSYFASVEQQANPFLRGRPVGVCAYLHEYGCVIAASVEAKRLGMKVGMTVHEARRVCPEAVFVENDPPKYRAVTQRVFSLLYELTDRVEHYSIDEAFLDLTGWYRDPAEAAWALARIRRRIRDEVGEWLRCSIGIAPTRFLAKTASDMEKPSGLVVITPETIEDALARLDLEDVCGIGRRIRRRLERLGIFTLLDLKRYPVENLIRTFGMSGFSLWSKVNGLECERLQVAGEHPPKSIGHSYCVPRRVNEEGKVVSVLVRLAERAARRVRREGFLAGRVSVAVGLHRSDEDRPRGPFWSPLPGAGGSLDARFFEPSADSFTLVGKANDLLRELWDGERVNFLAVTFSDFSRPVPQAALPWRKPLRAETLSSALDAVRDRYGDDAIMLGSMLGLGDEAPDRIGFRKTVGIEVG